jgi:trehalose/maltose hydrolase-like predicted phosphorylase
MLSFRPQRPPEARSSLRFSLTYRGRALEVEIAPASITYTMRVGDEFVFRHEDEVVTLTHAKPTAIRPTLEPWLGKATPRLQEAVKGDYPAAAA